MHMDVRMPRAQDAHDCMDAGGRATQGAVAEERRICGLMLLNNVAGMARSYKQLKDMQ